jgi:hypothetical protein
LKRLKFAPPVELQPVAGYSKGAETLGGKDGKTVEPLQTPDYSIPCWKNLINHTSVTIGCNNIFGQDPPHAVRSPGFGFPSALYDATGRFVYVTLTKKFGSSASSFFLL